MVTQYSWSYSDTRQYFFAAQCAILIFSTWIELSQNLSPYSVYKGARTLVPVKLTQSVETKTNITMAWKINTDSKVQMFTCK